MGRPAGHRGPIKAEEEKMTYPIRFVVTKKELDFLDARVKFLKLTRSSYFRTLMVGDITKNAN
jgi:hypothetical protein